MDAAGIVSARRGAAHATHDAFQVLLSVLASELAVAVDVMEDGLVSCSPSLQLDTENTGHHDKLVLLLRLARTVAVSCVTGPSKIIAFGLFGFKDRVNCVLYRGKFGPVFG